MRIDKDDEKEKKNIKKQGFDFQLAEYMLSDPLALQIYDRYENGEHRYHVFSMVGNTLLLLVYTNPDADDPDWLRVIGLRKADHQERRRYEKAESG